MAVPGQRFELDLDADDFAFNPVNDKQPRRPQEPTIIGEIQEHDTNDLPAAPKPKQSKSGFPDPKTRRNASAFKSRRQQESGQATTPNPPLPSRQEPSDAAVRHKIASKHGYDPLAATKAEISRENERKIATMSEEDIEEARAELMQSLDPGLLQRFLRRANIEEDQNQERSSQTQGADKPSETDSTQRSEQPEEKQPEEKQPEEKDNSVPANTQPSSSVHFPTPNDPSTYIPLDPSSDTFLADLRTTYFPNLTHTPSSLDWLRPSSPSSDSPHSYSPSSASISASDLRFSFTGNLIPPSTSLSIPTHKGLHHHGHAPDSAGYTIPELTLLARSAMPNQRSIAYQTLGRILYRLGKGEFGQKGTELWEGLWSVVEKERAIEVVMTEANGAEGDGHASARAYAVEALWLWRRGGGGERGVKKPGQMRTE